METTIVPFNSLMHAHTEAWHSISFRVHIPSVSDDLESDVLNAFLFSEAAKMLHRLKFISYDYVILLMP